MEDFTRWIMVMLSGTRVYKLDALGNTLDDYQQMLALFLWEKFSGVAMPKEFMFTVLRNKLVDYQRQLKRELGREAFDQPDLSYTEETPEQELQNKEQLAFLFYTLTAFDWHMLTVYAQEDSVKEVWLKYGEGISYDTFNQRFNRILDRCCELLTTREEFRKMDTSGWLREVK